jgi:hypothetical protein
MPGLRAALSDGYFSTLSCKRKEQRPHRFFAGRVTHTNTQKSTTTPYNDHTAAVVPGQGRTVFAIEVSASRRGIDSRVSNVAR